MSVSNEPLDTFLHKKVGVCMYNKLQPLGVYTINIEWLHEQDIIKYVWIILHIFLTSVTSGWEQSMETSEYGMVAQ